MSDREYGKFVIETLIGYAMPHIEKSLDLDAITFITAKELLSVTNEKPEDFLSNNPDKKNWNGRKYAEVVYMDFINNQTYFFDKLMRKNRDGKRSNR